jgi:hypothetical protein
VINEQRQCGQRRSQLVHGDRQKLVASRNRLPSVLEQACALVRDQPERGLCFGTLSVRVAQVLVEHEQAEQHLTHLGIGLGHDRLVGDRASTAANLGEVHQDAIGRAITCP